MRIIPGRISSLDDGLQRISTHTMDVAAGDGVPCRTFDDLQDAVATVSYYNPRFDIFLRGQDRDHRDESGHSSLAASIFRVGSRDDFEPREQALLERSEQLRGWARKRRGARGLYDHEMARWCLLQHYQCCPTPVVDVSRSVRIAATFATQTGDDDAFVYILGLPYPNGNITFDLDNELAVLNLRNLMPPDARRPHWQEGFLVASYPKGTYWDGNVRSDSGRPRVQAHNLARRLLCKLRIPKDALPTFWNDDHSAVSAANLAPDEDPVKDELQALFEDC